MANKVGRPRIDRTEAVQRFVLDLTTQYPNTLVFDRTMLQTVGDKNMIGMMEFTSKKSLGNQTRLSHGSYRIPESMISFTNPAWDGRVQTEAASTEA